MRRSTVALLLISLSGPTYGQVLPGDLLVNSWLSPEVLVHFRPDGTVVQTTGSGNAGMWLGAAILPNGNWVTTRRSPNGVNIFDAVTGAQISTWDMPPGYNGPTGDVDLFSDGSLAIIDQSGKVFRTDPAGKVLTSWSVCGKPFGILIDDQDEVWVCDTSGELVCHTDDLGNPISQFSTAGPPGDVTMAEDGSLFVVGRSGGNVLHYAPDGALLGSFPAGSGETYGIAMGADETIWVASRKETVVRNFDQAGNPLGTIDQGPAGEVIFLTILISNAEDIGTNYCGPANFNSTGQSAVISAFGDTKANLNLLTLTASQLPPNVFGYFLNSNVQGFTPFPPGSNGNLCLAGGIGRHAKQVANSGAAGEIVIDVDLTALPRPGGTHFVLAGETWNFQCWFRDNQGGPTSNFTDGIEIVFQ